MVEVNVDAVELATWLWCLRTPLVQAYAVRHRDGFNLIDTGIAGGEDAIVRALAAIDRKPISDVRLYEIVLTHGHDDHAGAAAALVERTGARVLASRIDTPIIEGQQAAPEPQLGGWELQLYEQIHPNVPPAPPVCVDAPLDDGASLGWDVPASVIAAPGHTPGSIAVLLPRTKTLIAGDAIAARDGKPILGVFNVDPSQARATFRRLSTLDVDVACFGHGDPVLANAHERLARTAAQI